MPLASAPKKLAVISDLSGLGRCSLSVALPVVSALGVQCLPVPTALLSTQTDGFTQYSLLDSSRCIDDFGAHWASIGLQPDGIACGFLATPEQVDAVLRFRAHWPSALLMVDPVLGDNGSLYTGFDGAQVAAMSHLAAHADVITPNMTEACLLLGRPYGGDTAEEARALLPELLALSPRAVAITGVRYNGHVGALCAAPGLSVPHFVGNPAQSQHYPGTGDLFAAILGASLCKNGLDGGLWIGAQQACAFCTGAIAHTAAVGTPPREGVLFEPLLPALFAQGANALVLPLP